MVDAYQIQSVIHDLAHICFHYVWLAILPFLCLNGILLALFLLKTLFFRPKFVENRHQTIAIDPGTPDLDFKQVETSNDGTGRGLMEAQIGRAHV